MVTERARLGAAFGGALRARMAALHFGVTFITVPSTMLVKYTLVSSTAIALGPTSPSSGPEATTVGVPPLRATFNTVLR